MTVLQPTRRPGVWTQPIRVDTLTGALESVLYAVGYARRVGALVRTSDPLDHGDGTVTVQVHHTLLVPLVLPQPLGDPLDLRNPRDWMDYVELVLRALPWLVGGGIVGLLFYGGYEVHQWFQVHATQVSHGMDWALAIGAVVLLLMLGGGGKAVACKGLHCGGCKG